ncbi:YfgM family protein [Craterilacuibacter sinensis]|uniref:Ancillary SecYEG translocon subunit n=1 Tax=Craterilacuibacter sinensis TaxID=2686017 RepID=A0A845BK02_9NEIS|nr:tetratricopeptide repeat protein [Craterilacuibacter sinensis]MXR35604.1 tetratricopeptide repeat protein [Craterilacuibacter sinensis]
MAFDLQEQEQIDTMRTFWQQWGKWLAAAVLVACAAYLGFKGWHLYQGERAEKASAVFAQLESAAPGGDLAKIRSITSSLQQEYGSTSYAPRASLLAAKLAFEKNDLAMAQSQLKWVIGNTKEPSVLAIAHLRLAAVLLDLKQYDGALAELNAEHPAGFDSFFLDMKGDVLFARGDHKAAMDAYKAALAKQSAEDPMREFVQAKIDAIGS